MIDVVEVCWVRPAAAEWAQRAGSRAAIVCVYMYVCVTVCLSLPRLCV